MKTLRQITADANRAQYGYIKPDDRARCGLCLSCKPHVTENYEKTNSNNCERYWFPVQVHGWCPQFRSATT